MINYSITAVHRVTFHDKDAPDLFLSKSDQVDSEGVNYIKLSDKHGGSIELCLTHAENLPEVLTEAALELNLFDIPGNKQNELEADSHSDSETGLNQ